MKFDQLVNEILTHQKNNLIVIFPGRFQPFHMGHKKLYDMAKSQFPGADFFIATTDEVAKNEDASRYPFNFNEKKEIIKATGIPDNVVRQVKQPYKPLEILKNYDPNVTKVIYLVGKKDMQSDARFTFGMTKKGTPSYFQPFKDLQSMQPFKEQGGHGYIYAPSTIQFNIGDKSITSATELRDIYKASNEATRKQIIAAVLGKFNATVFKLFNAKLS